MKNSLKIAAGFIVGLATTLAAYGYIVPQADAVQVARAMPQQSAALR